MTKRFNNTKGNIQKLCPESEEKPTDNYFVIILLHTYPNSVFTYKELVSEKSKISVSTNVLQRNNDTTRGQLYVCSTNF